MSSRDGAEERVNAVVRARQAVERAEADEKGTYPPERGDVNFEWKCEELGLYANPTGHNPLLQLS